MLFLFFKKRKAGISMMSSIMMMFIIMIIAFAILPSYFMIYSNREISSSLRLYSLGLMGVYDSLNGSEMEKLDALNFHFQEFLTEDLANKSIQIGSSIATVQKSPPVEGYVYEDPAIENNGTYSEPFFAIYGRFILTIPITGEKIELQKTLLRNIP